MSKLYRSYVANKVLKRVIIKKPYITLKSYKTARLTFEKSYKNLWFRNHLATLKKLDYICFDLTLSYYCNVKEPFLELQ